MGKFAISFFCITILLAISAKHAVAYFQPINFQKQQIIDQKDKSDKTESPEEDKDSKEDLKKNEFINEQSDYFSIKVSQKFSYGDEDNSLPSISQNIPKLPPKAY
jgi:hypothetical protein